MEEGSKDVRKEQRCLFVLTLTLHKHNAGVERQTVPIEFESSQSDGDSNSNRGTRRSWAFGKWFVSEGGV